MIILGTGGSDHDFSSTIIKDGELISAIEDERITRIKHGKGAWYSLPVKPSVSYCLSVSNLELDSVDYIFSNLHLEKRAYFPANREIKFISHHLSHAACAFFPSPFAAATIAIIDGAGSRISESTQEVELETVSIGVGNSNKVDTKVIQAGNRKIATSFWRYMCSNSIGSFYEAVTDLIGFGSYGAGKTMGLAAYGNDSLVDELRQFVSILPEGRFEFNPYGGLFDWVTIKLQNSSNAFMIRANLASAFQKIFEEAIVNSIQFAYQRFPNDNLCYGGGCALNTVANSKILEKTDFRRLFIHPATDDGGTAIGAACYGWYHYLDNPRIPNNVDSLGRIAYLSKEYSDEEIEDALTLYPVFYYQPSNLYEVVALRLFNNEVAGWFQGRSEIGPRALGNRSILANPSSPQMRDYINLRIKYRESFRPLAPIVLEEDASKYFEIDEKSPFMLLVAKIKNKFRKTFPAITHIDGTARLQTVNEKENKRMYDLLLSYKQISGYAVLLNTSFNMQGEPIVESPTHAIQSFLKMNLDFLVIGTFIVEKHTPWAEKRGGFCI